MKILQLCKKFPFPLKDGESIAINQLSKALVNLGANVSLLAMNTSKHFFNLRSTPDELQHYSKIDAVFVDNNIKPVSAFLNLFSKKSYHISRFISQEFDEKLITLLKSTNFDIIQLETLYLAPYISTIRKYSNAKIVMRSHNVEHEIWERVVLDTKNPVKQNYLSYLTKKLKHFEVDQLNNYDLLLPISQRDLDLFKNLGLKNENHVVPIGLDTKDYVPDFRSYKKQISLSFIGSLDWMPNVEGLRWFLNNIWSPISKHFPELEFHIAGRNTPKWLKQLDIPRVKVVGEVDCAKKFINQHSVMVVPLLAGSGMRAKILEAMALGKVVVSTSIGLEGIDVKDRKHVIIADSIAQFIDALDFCYNSNGSLAKIGQNAQLLANEKYNYLTTTKSLFDTYCEMTGKKQSIKKSIENKNFTRVR